MRPAAGGAIHNPAAQRWHVKARHGSAGEQKWKQTEPARYDTEFRNRLGQALGQVGNLSESGGDDIGSDAYSGIRALARLRLKL